MPDPQTEIVQLPPEQVRLQRFDSLTVGPHLQEADSVKNSFGFEGVSLVAKVDIPVDEPLDAQGPGQEAGGHTYYIFQAGQEGAWSIPYQIPQKSPDHEVFRMNPGDVSIIAQSDLEALQGFRSGAAAYDAEKWNELAARILPVQKGQQEILGRLTDRRLRSHMPDRKHYSSRRHMTVAVSPDDKVTLTDTSRYGSRVEARPGYSKTHGVQLPG